MSERPATRDEEILREIVLKGEFPGELNHRLPRIRLEDGSLLHIHRDGSREHVVSWSTRGWKCSEPECTINTLLRREDGW